MIARASAPGKLILLGEHAVVYGEPAVAVPAPGRVIATLAVGEGIEAAEGGAAVAAAFAAAQEALELPTAARLAVAVEGLQSGMGTSAALGAALARVILAWHGQEAEPSRVLVAAEAVERGFHGNPSGVDHTVAVWGCPVRFVRGRPPEILRGLPSLALAVRPRRSTVGTRVLVEAVARRLEAEPALRARVGAIGAATDAGLAAWRAGDLAGLGQAMRAQQAHLDALGVVDDIDRAAIGAAEDAGARAAKITGAGGGGTVIALADDPAAVVAAWGEGFALILG